MDLGPEIDERLCTGCGDCVHACPEGALAIVNGRARLAHRERCRCDGSCEVVCPAGAIQIPYAVVFADRVAGPGKDRSQGTTG